MKINVTLTTCFNWCVWIYWPLRFNRLVWIDRSVWLIWVWFVWPLGLYSSCATSLLTISPVIESIVISTTSSVHKLQTATFSYVIVPTWVVSCARSRISWQCTRICNQSQLGEFHYNRLGFCSFEMHEVFEKPLSLDKAIHTSLWAFYIEKCASTSFGKLLHQDS